MPYGSFNTNFIIIGKHFYGSDSGFKLCNDILGDIGAGYLMKFFNNVCGKKELPRIKFN